MDNKYAVLLLVFGLLVSSCFPKEKIITDEVKNSVIEKEEQTNTYSKNINVDVFKKLTKPQQKAIKNIIENIEDYNEDGVLPDDIDKDDFVVYEGTYNLAVELGKENNKIIVIVSKNLEDKSLNVYDVHMANDILNILKLPKIDNVKFLNTEQKVLYKEALEIFEGVFLGPAMFCDRDRDDEPIYVKIPDYDEPHRYVLCINDKFTNYKEFKDYVYSFFTKEFWDKIEPYNNNFVERDGLLYCRDGGSNWIMPYLGFEENRYELISKTDEKIEFYDINLYSGFRGIEGAKPEWIEIEKNKAVLEKVDGEWKVSELALPW